MNNTWLRRFGFAIVSVVPMLIVAFLQGQINHYSTLLAKYECSRAVCNADFDGDGAPGKLFVESSEPADNFDSWFVVEDSGRQILREPRRSFDTSLRTHAALIPGLTNTRLVVYDHIRDRGQPRSLVFAYDAASGRMVPVLPQKQDQDMLAALASSDDAGTRNRWLLFQFAKPILLGYLAVLAIVVLYRRKRKSKFS